MRKLRTTKLVGMPVYNAKTENLGEIQDIVLDQDTGTVAYGVLSFGGFLGMGDKLFAVPWSAMKLTADHSAFTLDMPKERLEKAPGFDKKSWPDLNSRQWGVDIHTYYGVKPYWDVNNGGVVSAAKG